MNTVTVNVADVPGRFEELVKLAASGTEVILQNGPTTAKLVAPAKREWVFNLHPGAMVMREDFDAYIDEEDFLKGNI